MSHFQTILEAEAEDAPLVAPEVLQVALPNNPPEKALESRAGD